MFNNAKQAYLIQRRAIQISASRQTSIQAMSVMNQRMSAYPLPRNSNLTQLQMRQFSEKKQSESQQEPKEQQMGETNSEPQAEKKQCKTGKSKAKVNYTMHLAVGAGILLATMFSLGGSGEKVERGEAPEYIQARD